MNVDKPLLGTVASPLSRAGRTNSQYTETFLSPHILNDNLFERRVGTQLQRSIRNGHLYRISEWGTVHSAPCFNSIANGMNTQLQNGCVPTLYGMSRHSVTCEMFDEVGVQLIDKNLVEMLWLRVRLILGDNIEEKRVSDYIMRNK